ncbi:MULTISPECIES: poly-beta-1,6-N-acetyl-D-glucosamine biosynthesis protein PgaD [unclassified Pseudomonas]|uniref:poly-beta-1,6-N-acetyl-D-glucosamine biosynthesis protein PgaD n=1 Tax=unclassified Pseudomonas TaxID=196821 RepID=UPI0004D70E8C|nr:MULTISPECIES: poly-beta-1,6-N-acetyl-D-glucosamine biosynthesis protein PgaD [unclassified Pseudomonas]KES25537.1 hypothetical protein FG99_05335 [Pseudomonas sp. AAC]OHR89097.1 hypothetical protein HMPREF3289_22960 [Pseudomonas sp. HMSC75E02]
MNLIKTPQHWLPRSLDVLLTLCAWAIFVWLMERGIASLLASGWRGPRLDWSGQFLQTLDTLMVYVLCSALIAALLVSWARYNQIRAARYERRSRMPDLSRQALSRSFNISGDTLARLHGAQVVTLHNDEHGNLVWVENPAEMEVETP